MKEVIINLEENILTRKQHDKWSLRLEKKDYTKQTPLLRATCVQLDGNLLSPSLKKAYCMQKVNCWEYMKCGREPGGVNTGEYGICPASTERLFEGVHGGINGGRVCWVIRSTTCDGHANNDFFKKLTFCADCVFYDLVKREEEHDFEPSLSQIKRIWNID